MIDAHAMEEHFKLLRPTPTEEQVTETLRRVTDVGGHAIDNEVCIGRKAVFKRPNGTVFQTQNTTACGNRTLVRLPGKSGSLVRCCMICDDVANMPKIRNAAC